jgi:hypothetical protein
MNIVKIYKEQETNPTFIIESEDIINSTAYTNLWNCKEEIYIDKELIETIIHT